MWTVVTDGLMCDSSLSCTSMRYFIFHTEACTMALLLVFFFFFLKLVLAACGKELILNGLVCHERHKKAAFST